MARSLDGVYTWLNLETPPGGGGPFEHPIAGTVDTKYSLLLPPWSRDLPPQTVCPTTGCLKPPPPRGVSKLSQVCTPCKL